MENTARKIPPNQYRKEIIGGRVVMMSPARIGHQQVAGNLYRFFGNYLEGKPCRVFPDGTIVSLSEEDQFVPDLSIVCDPGKIGETKITGAPDLVVEILSPSTAKYDRRDKMKVYEKHGVREYWIISIESRSVEVYLPENGCLELDKIYTIYPAYHIRDMDDAEKASLLVEDFRCSLFPDLPIPLEMIFALVGN